MLHIHKISRINLQIMKIPLDNHNYDYSIIKKRTCHHQVYWMDGISQIYYKGSNTTSQDTSYLH